MAAIRPSHILNLTNGTAPRSHKLPKVPNIDDIEDLTNQVQETTDALSRLLMHERKWMQRLSSENLQLLEIILDQFQEFCKAADTLLQAFSGFSHLFATLFGSVHVQGLQTYENLKQVGKGLCTQATKISDQIVSVEVHTLRPFTCSFRKLLDVAPKTYNSSEKHLTGLQNVFCRLDAFWKVVATYLSSVLECRLEPPHPHESMDAEGRWTDYILQLDDTRRILANISDSVEAVTPPKRSLGFKGLLRKFRNLFRS